MKTTALNHLLSSTPNEPAKTLTLATLALWFLFVLGCSGLGLFDSHHRPPIFLGAAVILPIAVFAVGYLKWTEFRRFVLSANFRFLTLAQSWRVGAVGFLILYQRGVLPGVFALPAGWGDIAIGVTAPLTALALSARKQFPTRTLAVWNVLGLLDLVMAVSLGILASARPVGILAGEITTAAMGRFPLSLIPTFFVPLLAILHLISLAQLRQAKRS